MAEMEPPWPKWLSTVPESVKGAYMTGEAGLIVDSERVMAATTRLVTDERMTKIWPMIGKFDSEVSGQRQGLASWNYFLSANWIFNKSDRLLSAQADDNSRDWDLLTATQRRKWFSDLRKLTAKLEALLESSPVSIEVLSTMGEQRLRSMVARFLDLPLNNNNEVSSEWVEAEQRITEFDLLDAMECSRWSPVDALRGIDQQASARDERSAFRSSRPSRPDTARKLFISELSDDVSRYCGVQLRQLVATTADVMFDVDKDKSTDVSVVRRMSK